MRRIAILFVASILLANYTFAEEQMEFSGENAKKEIVKCLSNSDDILLITIESIPKEVTCNKVTIHMSAGENNRTFEVRTPYCMKMPMGMFEEMKKEYLKIEPANSEEKEAFLAALKMTIKTETPNIIIVAQSQSVIGIQGKAYYKGKVFVSSVADVPYGVVDLNVEIPVERYILETSKP